MGKISNYLTHNEKILQKWRDGSTNIYATNSRVVLEQSGKILDIPYSNINSFEYSSKHSIWRITLGILLLVCAFFSSFFISSKGIGISIGLSLLFFAIIIFAKSQIPKIKMQVTGQGAIEFSENMKSIMGWIHDYKTKIESDTSKAIGDSKIGEGETEVKAHYQDPTEDSFEKFLKSAIKAMNKGDMKLARSFIEQAISFKKGENAITQKKGEKLKLKSRTHAKKRRIPHARKLAYFEKPHFRVCPVCGRELLPKAIYCDLCGAKLADLFKRAHDGGLFG